MTRRLPFHYALAATIALGGCDVALDAPLSPVGPSATTPTVAAMFELIGGYRLGVDYASEGLAIVPDAQGFAQALVGGAHAHQRGVHLYELPGAPGPGNDVNAYPLVVPTRTWSVATLYPRWMDGQTLRDLAVVPAPGGFALAGIGRVFYNTSPRAVTQINVREIRAVDYALGGTREVAVPLPEQEFTGFIKHEDRTQDLLAIGGGAYDSGQGSVGGLSYAVQGADGVWRRRLTPPSFGDLASPRLPRDSAYSCPEGPSWVCIPPANGKGVWSTERIGGGGVRIGNTIVFIATLGYGPRTYARQSYTFGDPAQDRAVAYFFQQDPATQAVTLAAYDRWTFAQPGELVIGVARGRLRGVNEPVLFVATSMAWAPSAGAGKVGTVVHAFRITAGG
ncbi:MAG: hypothetical protein IPK85_07010 [Gemmatimonadetes bacterium]|nr:hypothetical protein [Gemmatimonadota bacterium]